MLGALGFSVNQVSTPTAALDALANAPAIDAVLSDIMMPGGTSGLDLRARSRRRFPNLAIVLATAYAESAARLEDGEFCLLLKPYSLEHSPMLLASRPRASDETFSASGRSSVPPDADDDMPIARRGQMPRRYAVIAALAQTSQVVDPRADRSWPQTSANELNR
jgi:CheY-like chemotaxis protein